MQINTNLAAFAHNLLLTMEAVESTDAGFALQMYVSNVAGDSVSLRTRR